MNDPSCVLLSKFLGDDMMGYISHPNALSSWMLVFLPYHAKWGDMFSREPCILHIWTYADIFAAHHHFFSCWLLSRIYALTIFWMLLLCLLLFPLGQYASPPVVSMFIFNSSTGKFVTSVEFSNAPSSSIITCFHGCC